ncbi:MAG: hypothetical protein IJ172_10580 [Ruminococcus sp.]|nr:hypothetical protein [Ruminococcus sp.]
MKRICRRGFVAFAQQFAAETFGAALVRFTGGWWYYFQRLYHTAQGDVNEKRMADKSQMGIKKP